MIMIFIFINYYIKMSDIVIVIYYKIIYMAIAKTASRNMAFKVAGMRESIMEGFVFLE